MERTGEGPETAFSEETRGKLLRYQASTYGGNLQDSHQAEAIAGMNPGALYVNFAREYPRDSNPFLLHKGGHETDEKLVEMNRFFAGKGILTFAYMDVIAFLKDEVESTPEVLKWITRDAQGNQHKAVLYEGAEDVLYQGCRVNPGGRAHLKAGIRRAIDLGFNGMFFDNVNWFSCQCSHCQQAFDAFQSRHGNDPKPIPDVPDELADWTDPLFHEYRDFLCESLGDLLRELSAYARSLKSDFLIHTNSSPPTCLPPSSRVMPSYRINQHNDFLFYELGPSAASAFSNNIQHYTYGRAEAAGRPLVTIAYYQDRVPGRFRPNLCRLNIAEGLAFGISVCAADIMFMSSFERVTELKPWYDFVEEHTELYLNGTDLDELGLYFPRETAEWRLAYLQSELLGPDYRLTDIRSSGCPSFRGFVWHLSRSHIPFQTVLNLEDAKVKTLILPDAQNLTEQEQTEIRSKVTDGMNLVATHRTSLYDRLEMKDDYGLSDVFGVHYPGKQVSLTRFGKGRVAFTPKRPELGVRSFNYRTSEEKIGQLLQYAHGEEFAVRANAPRTVLMTAYRNRNGLTVHLVNYNVDEQDEVEGVSDVELVLPEAARSAEVFTPGEAPITPGIRRRNDGSIITIPRLAVYAVVLITTGEQ